MKEKRQPLLWEALLTFVLLIIVMGVSIAKYEANPHIPMLIGSAFAALMAVRLGYNWKEIEKGMFDGIYAALQAIIILAIIGILIGVWILSGVVPTMVYYGLSILTPQIFLVATIIICSITALATGTSWGAAGTVGIALMGVAAGLGIPAPMAAGAIISGVYFGDKMSPLSDTTNLAPAMAGTDVFTHIKFMLKPTLITYIIVLIIYLIMGLNYGSSGSDITAITAIQEGLKSSFTISPFLLIPPIAVIVSIGFKMPAIPGIFLGIVLGALGAVLFQGADLGSILDVGYSGFTSESGITAIDDLLNAGGITAMMYSISLTIFAMMFGGIMELTGQLKVIVNTLLKLVRKDKQLVPLTIATCVLSNATMPEQYISLVVPGRMYAPAFRERGMHPKMLSNALESSGTLSGALIPWNTCGAFMTTVLGVSTLQYAPYAVFNYLMPVVVIALTSLGFLFVKASDDPTTIITPSNLDI